MIVRGDVGKPVMFVSAAALESSGPQSSEAIIDAVYQQILKRPADPIGLQQYAPQLLAGLISPREIVRDLMHSAEWAARFIDDRLIEETVLALYDCVLARAPDVDGWNQLIAWEPRDGWAPVIDSMIDGSEYTERFTGHLVPGEAPPPAETPQS